MVVVLCTSSYDAYGNTCVNFINISWTVLKLLSGHDFVTETATYKVQRDVTKKSINTGVMVLALCMSSNVG